VGVSFCLPLSRGRVGGGFVLPPPFKGEGWWGFLSTSPFSRGRVGEGQKPTKPDTFSIICDSFLRNESFFRR